MNIKIGEQTNIFAPIRIRENNIFADGVHNKHTTIVAVGDAWKNGDSIIKIDSGDGSILENIVLSNLGIYNQTNKKLKGISTRRVLMSDFIRLYFDQCTGGGLVMGYGSHDNNIDRVTVQGFDGYGIELKEKNHATRIRNCIVRNWLDTNPTACIGIGTDSGTVSRAYSSGLEITGNRLEADGVSTGIYVKSARGVNIAGNYFEMRGTKRADAIWLGRKGTKAAAARGVTIQGNHFQGNKIGRYAIWARRCVGVNITGNHIQRFEKILETKWTAQNIKEECNYG